MTRVEPVRTGERTWTYATTPFGPVDVVVRVPAGAKSGRRYPVLIALHGRGEALKGPARGARGFIDDYWLPRAQERLSNPPLSKKDLGGFVTHERLEALNQELSQRPFEDLIVVCPYLPDILKGENAFSEAPELATLLVDRLLPRVQRETPAVPEAAATGIDGVSLGGRASLLVGFLRPKSFGAVGALQPALDKKELDRVARLAQRARKKNPKLAIRLLSSDEDYFLVETRQLSSRLSAVGVSHQLDIVTGTHSYEFNRGPGVFEMLLYHDRALR